VGAAFVNCISEEFMLISYSMQRYKYLLVYILYDFSLFTNYRT